MQDESARLLRDFMDGKGEAAQQIYDRYVLRLMAFARKQLSPVIRRRFDPEDVVQSVYRSFFRKAANEEIFLRRSGDLWRVLAGMTINKIRGRLQYEFAQKRNPQAEQHGVQLSEVFETEPTPEETAIIIDLVRSLLDGLKERDQTILQLRLQGEGIEGIANEADCSEAVVRRVLRKTREKLEQRLLDDL